MLLAIVPAYNEENTIARVIREVSLHVDEVVVIDDGSHDATAQCAKRAGATVLRHTVNRGQGAAIETGHEYARRVSANYVLHFDADGQFSPLDIPPAFRMLKQSGSDVLFGSRFLETKSALPFFKKYILFPLISLVNRYIFGIQLKDTHNGFRILTKKALEVIHITHDKMAHATEIPSLVHKHHLSYIEFPVKVTYHEYGQDMLDGVSVVADLVTGKLMHK